jgi:hypothetical protein
MAADQGLLDMATFDPLQYGSALRFRWALREVQRRQDLASLQFLHQHYLDCCSILTEEGAKLSWQKARESVTLVEQLLRPWEYVDPVKAKDDLQKAMSGLQSMWESRWGPMNSPETQEKIEETLRILQPKRKQAKPARKRGRRGAH